MTDALGAVPPPRTVRLAPRVTTKALPQDSRVNNRSLVLQMLFETEAMSRAEIARASGLTRASVSTLVAELVGEGVLAELGLAARTGVGKPGMLVGLDADSSHILALDLSADDRFIGAVINLRGVVAYRTEVSLGGATGQAAFEQVAALTAEIAGRTDRRVLGIGVGTPGIVVPGGTIVEAAHLDWHRFPLGARLADRFGLPVHVGNDANVAALAVNTFRGVGAGDLIVVNLEQGAGAGIVLGGALLEGEQSAAGEIGHVMIDEDGEPCVCGRRGCLELAIAVPHIRRRLSVAGVAQRDEVLAAAGRALGIALAPVISALNLNRVVLRGPEDIIAGPLLESARTTIRLRTMAVISDQLSISRAIDGEDLVLLGAAVLVLSALIGVS
ncbi:ROK family transcriptional regulator [Amnibacterium sp. CER49]|uniref:ROK family transcriptional regulator n=1 Tax=Amnibacterium sp. CER49 TaxID=3039161 RepID=UPI00244810F0|nr:ROK family transcriptional regulator [Amnibacterium sp. CER49]MDH2444071.1 ROK family transcriptional regulator [Amnibacterium sp. CER49]